MLLKEDIEAKNRSEKRKIDSKKHYHKESKSPKIIVTTIGLVVHSFSDGLALGSTIYAAG